jgi:3'-5' exonuclease
MLNNINPDKILFVDIETVPAYEDFHLMPEEFKEFWEKKSIYFRKDSQTAAEVYQRAGIYAEFGKIICISFGIFYSQNNERCIRIKSFAGENESEVLYEFGNLLTKLKEKGELFLCGHNGKEFDFPYISRRMLINGLKLPEILDTAGRKPWEVPYIDTLELWKFGDYKHYTSLELLTALFGIPSPKADIDGSLVASIFYKEKDLPRIVKYCQNDVLALAQLLLRFKGEAIIDEKNVILV